MPPPQRRSHPVRPLIALGAIVLVLVCLVFLAGAHGSVRDRLAPKLGLDLIGGTRVTLAATTPDGRAPDASRLEEARQIIENRVNGLGVAEASVTTDGNRSIVISVPGQANDEIKQIGTPAQLRFRLVLNSVADTATPPSSPASPAQSAAATPASGDGIATTTLATVQKKLGSAYATAQALKSPPDPSTDQSSAAALEPFNTLSPAEVAVLPASMQFNVPEVSCRQLNDRIAGAIDPTGSQVVACDSSTKYLLDTAKVVGTDVSNAQATINSQTGAWQVNLSFTGGGQTKWANLTKEAYANGAQHQIGVVLDNQVVSAPAAQGVITGDTQITGQFTEEQAKLLANQLRFGALPLTFQQDEAQTVSATLGRGQLQAGLLATGLGLALVMLYAFFYYRLLGSVIAVSLALSGVLVYGAVVVLGRAIGFTLTLEGMAGFIVSLGVAADSFVIYFERLKDEIRDGRSPRSAVPRAWARARRTIISANVITVLAAVVLYIVSVGTVKGFAFALGLATLLDLVVVFLFRHPAMTLFAGTKAFLSPRISGLGRVAATRRQAPTPRDVAPVAARTKEI
jgi:preprotein translocase subunit SecD